MPDQENEDLTPESKPVKESSSAHTSQQLRAVSSAQAPSPGKPPVKRQTTLVLMVVLVVTGTFFALLELNRLHSLMKVNNPDSDDKILEKVIVGSFKDPGLAKSTDAKPENTTALNSTPTAPPPSAIPDKTDSKPATSAAVVQAPIATFGNREPVPDSETGQARYSKVVPYIGKSDTAAEQALIGLVNKNPELMPARVELIQLYASKKQFDRAFDLCQEGVKISRFSGDRETFRLMLASLRKSRQ